MCRSACWTLILAQGMWTVNEILCRAYENHGAPGDASGNFTSENRFLARACAVTDNAGRGFAHAGFSGVVESETSDSQPAPASAPSSQFIPQPNPKPQRIVPGHFMSGRGALGIPHL